MSKVTISDKLRGSRPKAEEEGFKLFGRTLDREGGESQCRELEVGERFSPEISKRMLHEMHPLLAPRLITTSG